VTGECLVVDLRMDTKKTCVEKENGLRVQNLFDDRGILQFNRSFGREWVVFAYKTLRVW
jgi:hypothetical protein